jgi:hypothetical protein
MIMGRFGPSMLLCGSLALLVLSGCTSDYRISLAKSEIDLNPGEEKSVEVHVGTSAVNLGTTYHIRPDSVNAPEGKGVTVTIKGDKIVVSADKKANPGTVLVTLKGGKAKDETLKVNIIKFTK